MWTNCGLNGLKVGEQKRLTAKESDFEEKSLTSGDKEFDLYLTKERKEKESLGYRRISLELFDTSFGLLGNIFVLI